MTEPTADKALARSLHETITPAAVDVFGKLRWRPTARQQLFHDSREDEVLFGGSRGGGKTACAVMDGIRLCAQYPGLRALIIRRSFPQLKNTVIAELAKRGYARKLGARWNGTDLELRFTNGSLLKCGYVDSLVDTAQYQGTEWQAIVIDELGLLVPEALPILRETLRSSNPAVPVIGIRATANPGGPSHTYVKTHFVDATDDGRKVVTDEQGLTTRFIRASVRDNPHIDRKYLRRLEGIEDPARRKAMLDGDFSAFAGQVFQEWSADRHIIGPRKDVHIPAEYRRFAGIDYGFSAPWAVLWAAVDQDGRLWAYREMYERNLSPAEQARRIIDAERKAKEQYVLHFIDPSTQAKVHATAPSVLEMYHSEGLPALPADNERLSGWQTLHSYLAEGPICQFHAALRERDEWRGDTCPKFHVVEGTCPNLVRTLPTLPYDPVRVEDVDTKAEDHIADAARYLCAGVGGGLRPGMHTPWTTGEEGPRRLTVQELGGPEPSQDRGGYAMPNWNQGLEGTGVTFGRTDGSTPGATQKSPFS
jgi:hypothetical protein